MHQAWFKRQPALKSNECFTWVEYDCSILSRGQMMPLGEIHNTQIQITVVSIVLKGVLIDSVCFRRAFSCRLWNPNTALVSDFPLCPPHGASSVKLNSFLIWESGGVRKGSCCQTPLSTGHEQNNGQLMSRLNLRAMSARWGSPDLTAAPPNHRY